MKKFALIISLALSVLLASCSAVQGNDPVPTPTVAEQGEAVALDPALSRVDEQGAISVTVTPIDLEAPGKSLDFNVVLDTHSVDLSMDLALLAVLSTDSGLSVQAQEWEAPRGGHHVQGILVFPSAAEGKALLDGASELTLTIRELDAPERVFTWELSQ